MSLRDYQDEVEANFTAWTSAWRDELSSAISSIASKVAVFRTSYIRLVSLQAWRSFLDTRIGADGAAFLLEAQNDALTSHVLAACGSWRSALQALRSTIENLYSALYYKDHAIEAALWRQGEHRITHQELLQYLRRHPKVHGLPPAVTGLDELAAEYVKLSRAVHSGTEVVRMTDSGTTTRLWVVDNARLGRWSTRQHNVVSALNRLLLSLFHEQLSGTQQLGLRQAISLAVPASKHGTIRKQLGVRLLKS